MFTSTRIELVAESFMSIPKILEFQPPLSSRYYSPNFQNINHFVSLISQNSEINVHTLSMPDGNILKFDNSWYETSQGKPSPRNAFVKNKEKLHNYDSAFGGIIYLFLMSFN